MHYAVYSGTFNPLHIGHLAILRYLSTRQDIDRTLLIVSPQNPLKDASHLDNAELRLEAARQALRRHPSLKTEVDDIEFSMPAPHYTLLTLEALSRRDPDSTFTLVIGGDNLASIRAWKDYGEILRRYGIIVYPREGIDAEKEKSDLLKEDPTYMIEIADISMTNISSTEIRDALSNGDDVASMLM